ncbi:MAG: hypothetical protein JWQ01_4589, partial [Massilia sp.]|nr:hypothetical protein [Massilia sp.]
ALTQSWESFPKTDWKLPADIPGIGWIDLHTAFGGVARISAALVRHIEARAADRSLHITIGIASPFPGSTGAFGRDLELEFVASEAHPDWEVIGTSLPWFRDKGIHGPISTWMRKSSATLGTSGGENLPVESLGISGKAWGGNCFDKVHFGVFAAAGEAGPNPTTSGSLWLMLVTVSQIYDADAAKQPLNVSRLRGPRMRVGTPGNFWDNSPVILAYPLSANPDAFERDKSGWKALIKWVPAFGTGDDIAGITFEEFFTTAWNSAVGRAIAGYRLPNSGHPWLALPRIWRMGAGLPEQWPVFIADIPRRNMPAAAKQIEIRALHAYGRTPVADDFRVEFPWRFKETAPEATDEPDATIEPFVLTGRIVSADGLESGWNAPNENRRVSETLATAAATVLEENLTAGDTNLDLQLRMQVTIADTVTEWLNMGSFKLRPIVPPVAGEDRSKFVASLVLRLRGRWNSALCDIYPEIDLDGLRCEIASSALTDTAVDVHAAFDVSSRVEDELHRDSGAVLESSATKLSGTLRMRVRTEPDRDAVTEWSLQSEDRPTAEKRLYFQARPFTVARLRATEIDEQAGEALAFWRSDDKEGAQWRIGSKTVEFDLPPQAVGEEMERGSRFWPATGRYIGPEQPVRYRFSPPTRVTVRPTFEARRYNKNPNNLADILHGAKVERFVTEVLYPIRTEFTVSEEGLPDVAISESAAFFGRPAPNLPLLSSATRIDSRDFARIARDLLADEFAGWVIARAAAWQAEFVARYRELRARHSAARADFAARLAQLHLYDPWRRDRGLHLRDGLKFRIRDRTDGAPPLMNPLPNGLDLADKSGPIERFLALVDDGAGAPKRAVWGDEDRDGTLRAGAIHTIEYPSVLSNVLKQPSSNKGSIESLAFTALGATGNLTVEFDEGRTIFIADVAHGQLSRLVNIRIGRLAVLWNKAKHVIVYERTSVPSEQLKDEQDTSLNGWPVLRKTQEYVEPIEFSRAFATEPAATQNSTAFTEASEVISRRIYVNGAWGRDLGFGYELPLWDRNDTSGFYPKPQLALRMHAGGDQRSRVWLDEPENVYFYSNTETGTGADTDRWEAKAGVDCPIGPPRVPVLTGAGYKDDATRVLHESAMPSPRLGGARRPRFDLATVSDGRVNLQHGRGETEMLAPLQMVSLARTSETGQPGKKVLDEFEKIGKANDYAALIASADAEIRRMLARVPAEIATLQIDCAGVVAKVREQINNTLDAVLAKLTKAAAYNPGNLADLWKPEPQRVKQRLQGKASNYRQSLVDSFAWLRSYLNDVATAADPEKGRAVLKATADKAWAAIDVVFGAAEKAHADVAARLTEAHDSLGTITTPLADLIALIKRIDVAQPPNQVKAVLLEIRHKCEELSAKTLQFEEQPVFGNLARQATGTLAQIRDGAAAAD